MHELLLFGQVPASRHDQILKVLAGIAAMQPQLVVERHLIFRPTKPPGTKASPAGANLGAQASQVQALQAQMHGDIFYLQLVGDMRASSAAGASQALGASTEGEDTAMAEEATSEEATDTDEGSKEPTQSDTAPNGIDTSKQKWSLEFRDLPEVPGRRPVTSRLMASVQLTDGDPLRFMAALGYTYVSEYVLQGHQFIYNNIILLLHRPLFVSPLKDGAKAAPAPPTQLPRLETLRPLDPSNGLVLQASIRVQDGTKPETASVGINELKAFKETMKGVVEMEVGDRLALDTRAR